jgi:hypothetical protein
MTGHFGALIPGDRPQQHRRQIAHPRGQRRMERIAAMEGKMQQPNHPPLALDERADRGLVVGAGD